jgi:hypothetical protein
MRYWDRIRQAAPPIQIASEAATIGREVLAAMWTGGLWRGVRQSAAATAQRAPAALAPFAPTTLARLGGRALSSTAVRTVKLPQSLQSILNDFQKSKTLSRSSKNTPERMVRCRSRRYSAGSPTAQRTRPGSRVDGRASPPPTGCQFARPSRAL